MTPTRLLCAAAEALVVSACRERGQDRPAGAAGRELSRPGTGLLLCLCSWVAHAAGPPVPLVDHHQHLFSPATRISSPIPVVTAKDLVGFLDEAGIRGAVVLSIAYQFGNPNRPAVEDELAKVRAENDWTRSQVELYPQRLRAFCSVNPLKDYAVQEIRRCGADPVLRTGLKLHFGNSDVDVIRDQAALCVVFRTADDLGMALVLHSHANVDRHRPYGRPQALALLELLRCAPNVPVQVAHAGGAGSWNDPGLDAVLDTFAEAIAARDPRVAHLWFDVSGLTGLGDWLPHRERIARHLRSLGLSRLLFGSDGTPDLLRPREAWSAFRKLPLSEAEFARIANNVAPYWQ